LVVLVCWTVLNALACAWLWQRLAAPVHPVATAAPAGGDARHPARIEVDTVRPPASVDHAAAGHSEVAEVLASERRNVGNDRAQFLRRRNAEANVMEHYGYIFDSLPGLGPDERIRLAELFLEYESVRRDTRYSAAEQGIVIGSDAFKRAGDQMLAEVNAKLETFCEACPALREFLPPGKLNVQRIDMRFGVPLEFAGESLTLQQRLDLARVARQVASSGLPRPSVEAVQRGELPEFDAFLAQATPYLSERQLEVLRGRRSVEIAQYLYSASRVSRPRP
jgi:hypothetical protein